MPHTATQPTESLHSHTNSQYPPVYAQGTHSAMTAPYSVGRIVPSNAIMTKQSTIHAATNAEYVPGSQLLSLPECADRDLKDASPKWPQLAQLNPRHITATPTTTPTITTTTTPSNDSPSQSPRPSVLSPIAPRQQQNVTATYQVKKSTLTGAEAFARLKSGMNILRSNFYASLRSLAAVGLTPPSTTFVPHVPSSHLPPATRTDNSQESVSFSNIPDPQQTPGSITPPSTSSPVATKKQSTNAKMLACTAPACMGKQFESHTLYLRHMTCRHSANVGVTFLDRSALWLARNTEDGYFQCPHCAYKSDDGFFIQRHGRRCGPASLKAEPVVKLDPASVLVEETVPKQEADNDSLSGTSTIDMVLDAEPRETSATPTTTTAPPPQKVKCPIPHCNTYIATRKQLGTHKYTRHAPKCPIKYKNGYKTS
ncbi:hypothetical protein BC830DRAFT_1168106 [Chytriomyces sp. MP71]|nr:hypothetical protein BC830DRAFT_1168106 [Chytriomyces sp. MP71]